MNYKNNFIENRYPFKPDITNNYFNLLSGDLSINFKFYKRFIEISNYFIGLFENKTDDENFEKVESLFFKWLWIFGELFVTKFNDNYQFWSIVKKECDGIIVKNLECKLIYENYNYAMPNNLKTAKFENFKDGVYVCWNSANVYPAIVVWWEYIIQIVELENIFINNCIWDNKKFIYYRNNNDTEIVNEELQSISDSSSPFIKSISPITINGKGGLGQNTFQSFDFGDSKADKAYNNLQNYINYVFNKMGITAQVNLKKERKTMSESQMDLYNTLNIENITLRELKKFSVNAKKLWGANLDFGRVTDILDVKSDDSLGDYKNSEI